MGYAGVRRYEQGALSEQGGKLGQRQLWPYQGPPGRSNAKKGGARSLVLGAEAPMHRVISFRQSLRQGKPGGEGPELPDAPGAGVQENGSLGRLGNERPHGGGNGFERGRR